MQYVGTYCEVCGEEISDLYDCLCTKDKPTMRTAIKWFTETDIFGPHETQQLILLVKVIDTPIISLDKKREVHHQLAVSVAALKANYLKKMKSTQRLMDERRERVYLQKRRQYETGKSKIWKMYEKEVELDQDYLDLKESLENYTAAFTFLEDITRIMNNRGDTLNKMSDDRRQIRRMDDPK